MEMIFLCFSMVLLIMAIAYSAKAVIEPHKACEQNGALHVKIQQGQKATAA